MAVMASEPRKGKPGLTTEDRSLIERYAKKSYLDRSPDDLLPSTTDDPKEET